MRGFYVVKNPFVKLSVSINEGFSTIEGSTIEGFQCTKATWHTSVKLIEINFCIFKKGMVYMNLEGKWSLTTPLMGLGLA